MVRDVLLRTLGQFATSLAHNWPYLLIGILVSAALKLYADPNRIRQWLSRHRTGSVAAATGVAVTTPLCSCGTTAVILGMMASSLPWAPIVAFMVASPLTSPEELVYSGGLFGWPLALTYFAASIILGLAGGYLAHVLETRGWLKDQARMLPIAGGGEAAAVTGMTRPTPTAYMKEVWIAARRLILYFGAFAFIGYLLNNLIPQEWVTALFSSGKSWGVPLAATLGLPLYLNSEASLPLVRAFMDNGASAGAALAFLITGAGTSIGAIVGGLTIARWRVVGLVIGTLWVGALLFGYAFNAAHAAGLT